MNREFILQRYAEGERDFCDLILPTIDLSRTMLRGAAFVQSDLTRALLKRADFSHISLNSAILEAADLEGVNLSRSDLSMADLRHANLSYAILNLASLIGADLEAAYLVMTQLLGCDLSGVNLTGSASDYCWEGEDILPTPAMVSQSCSLCRRALVATVLPDPVEITHH